MKTFEACNFAGKPAWPFGGQAIQIVAPSGSYGPSGRLYESGRPVRVKIPTAIMAVVNRHSINDTLSVIDYCLHGQLSVIKHAYFQYELLGVDVRVHKIVEITEPKILETEAVLNKNGSYDSLKIVTRSILVNGKKICWITESERTVRIFNGKFSVEMSSKAFVQGLKDNSLEIKAIAALSRINKPWQGKLIAKALGFEWPKDYFEVTTLLPPPAEIYLLLPPQQ